MAVGLRQMSRRRRLGTRSRTLPAGPSRVKRHPRHFTYVIRHSSDGWAVAGGLLVALLACRLLALLAIFMASTPIGLTPDQAVLL